MSTCTREVLKSLCREVGLDPSAKKMGVLREMLREEWKKRGMLRDE